MDAKRLKCTVAGHNWAPDDNEHFDHLAHVKCTRCGRSRVDRPRYARRALGKLASLLLVALALLVVAAGIYGLHRAVELWTYSCHFDNSATCGLVRSAGTSTFASGLVKFVVGACMLFAAWRLWRRRPVRWVLGIAVGLIVVGVALPSARDGTAANTAFNPDPVFPSGAISQTTSHQIPGLTHFASVLAGRRAVVNCWSQRDWARLAAWNGAHNETRLVDASGITWGRDHHIELDPFLCEVLQQTLAKSADQPLFESFAVTVFAHESAHAHGIRNEGLAECRAIRTEPRAAALFGLSKAEGRRFQRIYRGTIYPGEQSPYRTPYCRVGLPGALVPDTLGSPSALRPLQRVGAAVIHALPGWTNAEGQYAVGPLSPCSVVPDRSLEVARYGTSLFRPDATHSSVTFQVAQLGTRQSFADVLKRFRAEPKCWLAQDRTRIRETHSGDSVALAPVPKAITSLSPEVRALRETWMSHGRRSNVDVIHIFDAKTLRAPAFSFRAPAGNAALAIEVRAVKAALRALR